MDDESDLNPMARRKSKRTPVNDEPSGTAKSRKERQALRDLIGKLDWDMTYDYKRERTRD